MSHPSYRDAFNAAVTDATRYRRPMGLERAVEFGREVFHVRMLPKSPARRFGWELRCQVVEPDEPLMP